MNILNSQEIYEKLFWVAFPNDLYIIYSFTFKSYNSWKTPDFDTLNTYANKVHLVSLLIVWVKLCKNIPSLTINVCMYNVPLPNSDKELGFEYWSCKLVTKMINTMLIYRGRWRELIKNDMTRYQLSVGIIFKIIPHVCILIILMNHINKWANIVIRHYIEWNFFKEYWKWVNIMGPLIRKYSYSPFYRSC